MLGAMITVQGRGMLRVATDVAQKLGAPGNGARESWQPSRAAAFQVESLAGINPLRVGLRIVVDPTLPAGAFELRGSLLR